jgi:hypothetical protein
MNDIIEIMVEHCAACPEPFRYSSEGQIYEFRVDNIPEFFWLCAACSARFKLVVSKDGSVHVAPLESVA